MCQTKFSLLVLTVLQLSTTYRAAKNGSGLGCSIALEGTERMKKQSIQSDVSRM